MVTQPYIPPAFWRWWRTPTYILWNSWSDVVHPLRKCSTIPKQIAQLLMVQKSGIHQLRLVVLAPSLQDFWTIHCMENRWKWSQGWKQVQLGQAGNIVALIDWTSQNCNNSMAAGHHVFMSLVRGLLAPTWWFNKVISFEPLPILSGNAWNMCIYNICWQLCTNKACNQPFLPPIFLGVSPHSLNNTTKNTWKSQELFPSDFFPKRNPSLKKTSEKLGSIEKDGGSKGFQHQSSIGRLRKPMLTNRIFTDTWKPIRINSTIHVSVNIPFAPWIVLVRVI